jgi:hypothetical protein
MGYRWNATNIKIHAKKTRADTQSDVEQDHGRELESDAKYVVRRGELTRRRACRNRKRI